MGLRFGFGLPGPFSYSTSLTPKIRRRRTVVVHRSCDCAHDEPTPPPPPLLEPEAKRISTNARNVFLTVFAVGMIAAFVTQTPGWFIVGAFFAFCVAAGYSTAAEGKARDAGLVRDKS